MNLKELVPAKIAHVMGLHESNLWRVVNNIGQHYNPTRPISVKGKIRKIDAPKYYFKKQLRRLHRFLQKEFPPHPAVHGGAKGRSCFTSARLHAGKPFIVSRDIKDCYPSISEDKLLSSLREQGFRSDTSFVLSRLLTHHGHIAQGSPVSGDALNLFFRSGDHQIATICGRKKEPFSRTYDDLTISSRNIQMAKTAGKLLEQTISDHRLKVNTKKRHTHGLRARGQGPRIHNLDVAHHRGVGITKEQAKKAMEIAVQFNRGAHSISPDSVQGLAHKRSMLHGWICHCQQATFGPVSELRRRLGAGDRIVNRKLKALGLTPYRGKWWLKSPKRDEPERLARAWRNSK